MLLHLTPAGQAILASARLHQQEALQRSLDRLDESERRSLMIGLAALDRTLDATGESRHARPDDLNVSTSRSSEAKTN